LYLERAESPAIIPLSPLVPVRGNSPRVVVFGAGAFGGWTALALLRSGASVTLVEAWAPGHARASSGGETRIIRATYGTRAIYTKMALRALELWRDFDRDRELLRETGVLWMFRDAAGFGEASARVLADHGAPFERLTHAEATRRYPQVRFDDAASIFFEPQAGYLQARRACERVVAQFSAEGGVYKQGAAIAPVVAGSSGRQQVTTTDGARMDADAFVFACGPWLPELFPDVIADRIVPTRQEVYYFGTPAGDARFCDTSLPVWIDIGSSQMYGIPSTIGTGFKVADDASGPRLDPTSNERVASADGVARARGFLADRFPALADAPLVGSEVCQYESTPDSHLIIDRHPLSANVWILGGGSGHGFKMGPALGEMVAELVFGNAEPDPQFGLGRFAVPPDGGWDRKWS
jgi:glycine/D-amino acid oxidase-like deaminating enzyme